MIKAAAIVFALAWSLAPVYWTVTTSFKTELEAARLDPTLWPRDATFANYVDLWSGSLPFGSFFTNTAITSLTGQVWFELLNGGNQVVQGPTFVQATFTAGNTQSFFFALAPGLASGTYTAKLFVVVNGNAYSASYTATVTVS